MALYGGRNFTKDDPRINRKGPEPIPQKLRELIKADRAGMTKKIIKYRQMTKDELRKAARRPGNTLDDLVLIKFLLKAWIGGSINHFDFLLNRSIGKVQDNVKLSGSSDEPVNVVTVRKNADKIFQNKKLQKAALELAEGLAENET